MTSSASLGVLRVKRALVSAGLDPDRPLVRIESATNEVWAGGDVVVRLNRRANPRLRREAMLAGHLPPEVRYPKVLATGVEAGDDWLVLERAPGTPLVRCWPLMNAEQRRNAVSQLLAAVRALHATPAPPELPGSSDTPQLLGLGQRAIDPLCEALERASKLEHVDEGAVRETIAWVRLTRGVLDPFEATTLVHGDLHFQNVLWDGERVTALLDLEWARAAPPDVDLDVLLRFCVVPFLFVPEGREDEAKREDYADVPFWLKDEYPEWFAHPKIFDRLRLYSVGFDTRDLLANPPTRPSTELTRHHPYRRLLATMRGASHLDLLAAR